MTINKWSDERASITLESAIVLPILIFIIFSFIIVIDRVQTEFHLKSSVSSAVNFVAANYYPIREANTHLLRSNYGQQIQNISSSLLTVSDLVPFLTGESSRIQQSLMCEVFRTYVNRYVESKRLKKNNLKVTRVILPNMMNGEQSTFAIHVSYTYVTIFNQTLNIKVQASERVWIGNGFMERHSSLNPVRILSIAPNPVQRGTKALITATAPAGSNVTITIRYKSGTSVAKGLIPKIADRTGAVSWQWKVGGNTTPGLWKITVQATNYSDVMYFEVLRK
jgi:hypothetical protein